MTEDRPTSRTRSAQPCPCQGEAGFPESSGVPLSPRSFAVQGMDCAEEVTAVKHELTGLVGSDHVTFDLLRGEILIACPAEILPDEAVVEAVARAGLRAVPSKGGGISGTDSRERHGLAVATAVSGGAIVAGLLAHVSQTGSLLDALGLVPRSAAVPVLAVALYGVAVVAGAWFVLPRAWAAARARRADMNLLMTIALVGAAGLGEWLEAASVAFLFAAALLLESWNLARSRRAVRTLLELAPPTARLLDDANSSGREVPVGSVEVGQTVLVKPGERVPLDGEIRSGAAFMDVSPITGEGGLHEVGPGDPVFAGSLSTDGALEVRVTHEATDTFVAHVVRRVVEAGRRHGRAERWVDRFAAIYTPAVLAAAIVVAILPPLTGLGTRAEWFYRSLVLLVIGCPCALVISTPVTVVASLTAAAKHGVLVKGGDILELPARLGAVALDKTGTLTEGRPRVLMVTPHEGRDEAHILTVAAALEQRSGHPIAQAIVAAAASNGLTPPPAADLRILPGRGVEGTVAGSPAWLGSRRLLDERNGSDPVLDRALESAAALGQSVVVVGEDDHICGVIALGDEPRGQAASVVKALHQLGIHTIALLTGDSPKTAAAVGDAVGIRDVHGGLLPEDKAALVEEMRRALSKDRLLVAFVGDGINDAPALAAADLGIAMAEAGSDAAIETADVALVASDLTRLPWLVLHSRRATRVIRANVAFALAVKASFVLLTILGHASLWGAIAADMGASLAVTANGLRLLRS